MATREEIEELGLRDWGTARELDTYTGAKIDECLARAEAMGREWKRYVGGPVLDAIVVGAGSSDLLSDEFIAGAVEEAARVAKDVLMSSELATPGAMYEYRDVGSIANVPFKAAFVGDYIEGAIVGPGDLDEPRGDYVIAGADSIPPFSDAPTNGEYMAWTTFAAAAKRFVGRKLDPIIEQAIARSNERRSTARSSPEPAAAKPAAKKPAKKPAAKVAKKPSASKKAKKPASRKK